MRHFVFPLLLLAACGGAGGAGGADGAGDTSPAPLSDRPMAFQLGFWATVDEEDQTIRKRTRLESGTPLRMVVAGRDPCSVYVVMREANGEIDVLHDGAPGPAREILAGELDNEAGVETFYVIAAQEPLGPLERAIAAWRDSPDRAREVLDEILDLRKRFERLEVKAPRPVPIGGQVRSDRPEPEAFEYEVPADPLCLTFTVDHR